MKKPVMQALKECIDRGIEHAMETPAEDCRVPFDIGTEIQCDIWDEVRSAFYFEDDAVKMKRTHEEMLMDISDWVNDESNTEVAPADESNTDVAEKREWIGLSDDEIEEVVRFPWHYIPFARAIEAKLKEKNT